MATLHWTIDNLPWDRFDASKVDPEILKVIKAAAMVEYNAEDYAAYLCSVFADDPEFQQAARDWAIEETQHGKALGEWAKAADPGYPFEENFARFRAGFKIDTRADASIRGGSGGTSGSTASRPGRSSTSSASAWRSARPSSR